MKIHFVTGKGGVGKSAVAAALALKIAKDEKKRVLLVELGDESFYQEYFNLPGVGHRPMPWQGIDVALWTGPSCLRDYAIHLLKVERLYKLFFENPVSRTLINVAPGLSELSVLGKITSGPPRNVGPKIPYDCLVIDSFATGHFLSLLNAPIGLSEAIQFGPMGEQSREIVAVLKDPVICSYHIVSLPEELPVQESIELQKNLRKLLGVQSNLWLNKWVDYPSKLDASGSDFERDFFLKNRNQNKAKEDLVKEFPDRLQILPFVFDLNEEKIVQNLSEGMRP